MTRVNSQFYKRKVICHGFANSGYSKNYNTGALEIGKIYYTTYSVMFNTYSVYHDGQFLAYVSEDSFDKYFRTIEQMRDIKLNEILK